MDRKSLWISIIAVALSFVGGFLLANAINRSELETLRSENERLKSSSAEATTTAAEFTLTNEEIDRKIAEADQNAANFRYQKNLGLALYRYGSMKQNPEIIAKSIRILERASALNSIDNDVIIGLGNAHFDVGYFGKDNAGFERSREFYERALHLRPGDVEVQTDIGLTYFLQDPPELKLATENFQKSLKTNPSHEKTLQFIIQVLVKDQKPAEAEQYLEQLKKANPSSQSVSELSTIISNAKSGAAK